MLEVRYLRIHQRLLIVQIASDHKVKPRTEANIKALATRCRQIGGIDHLMTFNVLTYLRRFFQSTKAKKGKLLFAVVPETYPKDLPHVEYDPLTLFTSQRILNRAEIGHPFTRFQLAHETGHIIMHDGHAKAFSDDKNLQISFENEIYSAEWQANTFAKYFLLPDWIMYRDLTEDQIISAAQVPPPLFEERREDIILLNKQRGAVIDFKRQTQFSFDLQQKIKR